MLDIDKYAYASRLNKQEPMEKLVFALLTMGVCLWADNIPVAAAVLLIMTWVTVFVGGTPFKVFARLIVVPMSFLVIGVLTIAFGISQNAKDLIFGLPFAGTYIGMTGAGLHTASRLFFKALGTVACLYYLSLNTPMVYLLSTLRRLKCPKLMVELMGLIYRFIFVLLETADTMFIAQNSRLGYISLKAGFRSMGALASTLFIRAYKRSDDLYTALEARGYDGELNVLEEPFEGSLRGYLMPLAVNIGLVIAALYFKGLVGGSL